jgi:hypothetical protein
MAGQGRERLLREDCDKWIADSIKAFSAHWLYTRDRSDGLTMIHKLANASNDSSSGISPADAVRVLRSIVDLYDTERDALKVEEHTGEKSDKALATIGLLSRSGHGDAICPDVGCPVTALTMAMVQDNEDMVSLLLDDYTHQILVSNVDIPTIQFTYASVQELREAEVVRLFEKFPSAAAEFFCNLPLLNTKSLVMRGSKCRLDDDGSSGAMAIESMLGQGSLFKIPRVKGQSLHSADDNEPKWWDNFIDARWKKSGRTSKRLPTRHKDLAWGDKVQSLMVPIRGALNMRERKAMHRRESEMLFDTETTKSKSEWNLLGSSEEPEDELDERAGTFCHCPPLLARCSLLVVSLFHSAFFLFLFLRKWFHRGPAEWAIDSTAGEEDAAEGTAASARYTCMVECCSNGTALDLARPFSRLLEAALEFDSDFGATKHGSHSGE